MGARDILVQLVRILLEQEVEHLVSKSYVGESFAKIPVFRGRLDDKKC